ncbi:uncharacterized protein JCM15063_002500 [Sporobolomyces koalae]|uniref:uncharacterized protein n=1 Tax=Sporobolomyces koalae TaxID=500713 RepID=UPI0031735AA2
MSYQMFPDTSPETAEFLSSLPHRSQGHRPSQARCIATTLAIFLVLFFIALLAAFIVDKSVPQASAMSDSMTSAVPPSCIMPHKIEHRIQQLERRMVELEKRAELQDWIKLDESIDKED